MADDACFEQPDPQPQEQSEEHPGDGHIEHCTERAHEEPERLHVDCDRFSRENLVGSVDRRRHEYSKSGGC
jgi:hypothetical protein